jgi:multicomponent Na+:H+ antiporter subunit G
MLEITSIALLITGSFFYFSGTVGLLRFPDVYSRLHALSKADNIGLGFIILGLALQSGSLLGAFKLLLIWPLAIAASSGVSYAIAHRADSLNIPVWKKDKK